MHATCSGVSVGSKLTTTEESAEWDIMGRGEGGGDCGGLGEGSAKHVTPMIYVAGSTRGRLGTVIAQQLLLQTVVASGRGRATVVMECRCLSWMLERDLLLSRN
jgi:hypothetical protein